MNGHRSGKHMPFSSVNTLLVKHLSSCLFKVHKGLFLKLSPGICSTVRRGPGNVELLGFSSVY